MSHGNRLSSVFSVDNLDVTVAKLGILVCVLLLGLRLFASQVLLVIIPVAAGTACIIYVVTRRRQAGALAFPALPGGVIGYLPALVFLGLAIIVAGIRVAGHRTGIVYLLTGLVGSLILVQILLAEDGRIGPGPVLFQILVAAVVIRLTVVFTTPGYIGVDSWSHIPDFVGGIVASGSIASMEGTKYILAPFYHVIGAMGATVFGSARAGTFLTVGLIVPLSAMLVYGTSKLLIPARWALLATALYAFADQFIRWGIHIIPTSLGLVFFLATLYCVTKVFFTDDRRIVLLLLLFSLATVYTHQVSTAIVLVLLGTAAFVASALSVTGNRPEGVAANSTPALVSVFGITFVVTIVTWAVTPWSGGSIFLWRMLDTLQRTVVQSAGFLNLAGPSSTQQTQRAGQTTGLIAELIPYIEWFGFGLLLLITVLGGLVMLRKDEPTDLALTYILTSGAMFVLTFGLALFGIRSFLPGRWYAFLYAPMAIIGAVGLYYISQNASRRVILTVFVLLAFGYPTTMVVGEKATLDSPAFDDEYPRYAYTESEIAAVETVSSIYPPSTTDAVWSDHPYQTIYYRYGGYEMADAAVVGENGPVQDTPTVYREYQSTDPALMQAPGEPEPITVRTNTYEHASMICPDSRNQVYSNDKVTLCTTTPVTGGGGDA